MYLMLNERFIYIQLQHEIITDVINNIAFNDSQAVCYIL